MPPTTDLAQGILLRGRASLASVPQLVEEVSQKGLALTGRLVPLSTSEEAHRICCKPCSGAVGCLGGWGRCPC